MDLDGCCRSIGLQIILEVGWFECIGSIGGGGGKGSLTFSCKEQGIIYLLEQHWWVLSRIMFIPAQARRFSLQKPICVKFWTASSWFCQRLAPAIKSIPLHRQSIICISMKIRSNTLYQYVTCQLLSHTDAHSSWASTNRHEIMLFDFTGKNTHEWLLNGPLCMRRSWHWLSICWKIRFLGVANTSELLFATRYHFSWAIRKSCRYVFV